MLYNEKALRRLVTRINMETPLSYLIKGRGAEKIYRSLGREVGGGFDVEGKVERIIKRGDYSVVAEVIGGVVDFPEFRFKKEVYGKNTDFPTEIKTEIFTTHDIEDFKRFYGIGYGKAETYRSVLNKKLLREQWAVGLFKIVAKSLFPNRVKLKEEKELEKTTGRAVKILRDKYRPKIWRYVHEKLTELS
ncbi:MAG: hypothetical protein KAT94_03345 [Candidatus Aenigmarchaeota archaeon]|nr:hypothetical protein [Candidatus Aenigmarchaeota archaeon]